MKKSNQFNLRVTPKLRRKIDELADTLDLTVSACAIGLLERGLEVVQPGALTVATGENRSDLVEMGKRMASNDPFHASLHAAFAESYNGNEDMAYCMMGLINMMNLTRYALNGQLEIAKDADATDGKPWLDAFLSKAREFDPATLQSH